MILPCPSRGRADLKVIQPADARIGDRPLSRWALNRDNEVRSGGLATLATGHTLQFLQGISDRASAFGKVGQNRHGDSESSALEKKLAGKQAWVQLSGNLPEKLPFASP
jgi:hypothetical protein